MGLCSVTALKATQAKGGMQPPQGSRPLHHIALGVDCFIHWKAVLGMGQHVKEVEGQVILPTCTLGTEPSSKKHRRALPL